MAELKQLRTALTSHIRARESDIEAFIRSLDNMLRYNVGSVVADIEAGNLKGMEAARMLGRLEEILREGGLQKEVTKLYKIYAEELREIGREFNRQKEFEVLSDLDRPMVEALIEFDVNKTSNRLTEYVDDVRSTVMRGVILGSAPDFSQLHEAAGGGFVRDLNNELRTNLSAFNRTVTLKKANDVGFELFIYLGPDDKATRPFCAGLLEKDPPIYTLDEIEDMDNGQDLPVAQYGGGYNCRHQWRPISEESAKELGYRG